MKLFEKLYTLLVLSAVIIGLAAGQVDIIRFNAQYAIVPLLVLMLYMTFLQIPIEKMKQAFGNVKFSAASLLINFISTPLLAWFLASLFLGDEPALFVGFIMLMVTPCTDWYLLFTGMAKGNTALATAVLPVNLLLQIALLPLYLLLFASNTVSIELSFLLESVIVVLLVPLLAAISTKRLIRNKMSVSNELSTVLSRLPILFLCFAIAAMFASQGVLLLENLHLTVQLLLPILLFFIINFFVGQIVGQKLKFTYEDKVSLSLTTLARNSPVALAIAIAAFPDQPLIALTLLIGPLLELPILAIIAQLLLMMRKNDT